jgi:SAM-dependent methyltransferase
LLRKLLFNLWYFQKPPWDTGISPPELVEFIETHPPGSASVPNALDLGCGTGTNVITLARCGWQVTGVDFARRAVQIARRKARQAGVSADFRVDDVTRLKGITGPFDMILDIGCFHMLDSSGKETYLNNLERLLSPTGAYLMYGFFKDTGSPGPGLVEADVAQLSDRLRLLDRQDGYNRGVRPSAWFTFGVK